MNLPELVNSIDDMVELEEYDFIKTDLDPTKYMTKKADGGSN